MAEFGRWPRLVRKIRHCKTCEDKCDREESFTGCLRFMGPLEPLIEFEGKTFGAMCVMRIWFDKEHQAVDYWREPSQQEWDHMTEKTLAPEEWDKILKEELEVLKKDGTT